MEKAVWQILVPCQYNSGKPVRTRHHREWDKRVRKISNGLTILPPAKGQWVNEKDGTLYTERVIPVMIIATADQMKKISKITAKHYDQIAVMYFKMSSESHIDYYA